MKSKERIITALNCKQPDKIPIFELLIDEISIIKLSKILLTKPVKTKAKKTRWGEERLKILDYYCLIIKNLKLDAATTNFSKGLKIINENYGKDRFGTIYHLSPHGEPFPIEGPIKQLSDVKGLDMVSKLSISDFEGVKYVINDIGKDLAQFMNISDPFKMSWTLRGGMQNLLLDYRLNPKLVHELAHITTEFNLAAIDIASQIGVDVIAMGGDLAGEESLLISPVDYREYIKPYHKILVDYTHKKGLKIIKHSDGNLWHILNDLIEVGFDGLHPIQPQSMDIEEVKKYLEGKVCVLGNIDCRNLLPFGTELEVERTVKETIDKVAKGGGFIISSSNSIHPGVNPENYIAMVNSAHKYGGYKKTI